MAAARIKRWALQLAAIDYTLKIRPSHKNGAADGLSRLPLKFAVPEGVEIDHVQVLNVTGWEQMPLTATTVAQATKRDQILSKVIQLVREGWPEQRENTLPSELQPLA